MISKSLSTSRRFAAVGRIGKLAEFAQLLFPLLTVHADDYGRLEGDPFTVKHIVFPISPRRIEDFDRALDHLEEARLITRYTVNGEKYIQINNFDDHQQGLHKRTKPHIPEPPGNSGNLPFERKGIEGELEGEGEQNRTAALADRFERFWFAYPRKVGKDAALGVWKRLRPGNDLLAQMLTAVERQKTQPDWSREGGKFIPHPRTWLGQGRWKDEPTTIPTVSRRTEALARSDDF